MAKNDLSSKTPPGPHAYEPLSASDDDRNWDRKSIETSIASSLPEEESEGTAARESHDRSRLRRTRIIAWIQGFVIVILLAAIVRQRLSDHRPPLGVDPTGFVPDHVGGPLRWTNYVDDENDPYFVTKDVFDNIDNVRTTAARLKAVHNSSVVYINGKHTTYMDVNGVTQPLPPLRTSHGSDMYLIRALHQLHCVAVIVEGIGYPLNNVTPKWTGEHLAHCVNNLRGTVACLADSTPIARPHMSTPGQYVHTTDGQQSMCRDIHGLLKWAHDPERRVKGRIFTPVDEEDNYEELPRGTE